MNGISLKQAKKHTDMIWKYLSTHSDRTITQIMNKANAIKHLKIPSYYKCLCPLCEYTQWYKFVDIKDCEECPIVKKYNETCYDLGFEEWEFEPTKANAKIFYDNIKECLK